jgi:uncharacterized protein YfaQ (DUF2300 family)
MRRRPQPASAPRMLARHFLCCCLVAGWSLTAAEAAAGSAVELVFGDPEAPTAVRVSANGGETMPVPASTPLGSLWKVFMYAYLSAGARNVADYRCSGRDPAEESYCCAPGERIGRDEALAKSCGLYFMPRRVGVSAAEWRAWWTRQAPRAPAWLFDLDKTAAGDRSLRRSLLAALAAIDGDHRRATMAALQRVSLEPRARPLLSHLGNGMRVKTWSWHDGKGRRIGGFAGWLSGRHAGVAARQRQQRPGHRAGGALAGRSPAAADATRRGLRARSFFQPLPACGSPRRWSSGGDWPAARQR